MFSSMPPGVNGDAKKGNWFWSLRRQPKAKKSILEPDKPKQKSCVDLSASNGTLYDGGVGGGCGNDGPVSLPQQRHRLDDISASSSSIERRSPTSNGGPPVCTCEYVQLIEAPETNGSISTTATVTRTVSRHHNELPSPSLENGVRSSSSSCDSHHQLALNSGGPASDESVLSDGETGAVTTTTTTATETNSCRRRAERVYTAQTVTTVTKTTVMNRQRTYRVGLIFSDNGELLNSNLDLRQLVEESKQNFLHALGRAGAATDLVPSSEQQQQQQHQTNEANNPTIPPPPRLGASADDAGRPAEGQELNNNQSGQRRSLRHQFSILDDSNFDYIDDSADLFNRNYPHQSAGTGGGSGGGVVRTLPGTAGPLPITKVLKMCNNCKNKSNLVYKLSSSQPSGPRKQINDELIEVESEMKAHESKEENKHSNKDKQMALGRKKFNMDPKKGIEFLYENQLLKTDPQDVAQFLYKGEGLNKTAIGDYLGEKNDFNEQVLKAFVELHDFTNLILVQALRQFLWSFRLPGEAQKIDRMMECFAQRYCQLNPDIFTNTDTCYVLSFAIIMLNTSLHNPSVKDKPTVEQFISMNRGINNGGDLPRELLESLYESIRAEPFKIPQDDGNDLMHTFFNPDKEGWLWKQGGRYKSWKRRWFILNDNCLYYFEYTTDKEPRGIIPLENIAVREVTDRSKPHCFELHASGGADIIKACKTDSEGKVVEGKHTVYRMSAATEEEQQEWISRLNQSISHNPFHDILVQRKKKALAKS
uniref:Putative guanine nucleotide exchange factor cytohesin n=1 Tax=Anopheles triannulatus TaxID=58253 RepID=A0A2M4A7S2_9DIPT